MNDEKSRLQKLFGSTQCISEDVKRKLPEDKSKSVYINHAFPTSFKYKSGESRALVENLTAGQAEFMQ